MVGKISARKEKPFDGHDLLWLVAFIFYNNRIEKVYNFEAC
jgi:hypothetical protein